MKGDYHKEVNYKGSLEPKFYSDNKSFWVTLFNLNYDVPIEANGNFAIDDEKVAIDDGKVAIDDEKVAIESINSKCVNADLTNIMKNSIIDLYQLMKTNRIFGRQDISECLNFSYANAGKVIAAMKKADVIVKVTGKGKGKYEFKI